MKLELPINPAQLCFSEEVSFADSIVINDDLIYLVRPLSYDELTILLELISDNEVADNIFQYVNEEQEGILLGYSDDALAKWVHDFLLYRSYSPLALPDLHEREAEFLFEFQQRFGDEFALRLRTSVAKFCHAYVSIDAPADKRVLQAVLQLIGLFSLTEITPNLIRRIQETAWCSLELRSGKAGHFAIRVLADICDESTVSVLQQYCSDPHVAAAIYEGILSVQPTARESLFLPAARGAAQARENVALLAVCLVYMRTAPAEFLAKYKSLLESLLNQGTEISDRISIQLISAATQFPQLLRLENKPAGDYIEPEQSNQQDVLRLYSSLPQTVNEIESPVPLRLTTEIRTVVPPWESDPTHSMSDIINIYQLAA